MHEIWGGGGRERDIVNSKQPNSSSWTLASRPNPPTTSPFQHPSSHSGTWGIWGAEKEIEKNGRLIFNLMQHRWASAQRPMLPASAFKHPVHGSFGGESWTSASKPNPAALAFHHPAFQSGIGAFWEQRNSQRNQYDYVQPTVAQLGICIEADAAGVGN